jgi:hypothetical protein
MTNRTISLAISAALLLVAFEIASAQPPQDRGLAAASEARDEYWQLMDAADYTTAFAQSSTGSDAQQLARDAERLAADVGTLIERRVIRTTVYDNPPGAPEPGVYVAFDFAARFSRTDRFCGYIILHQPAPGEAFRVTRTDQSYVLNSVFDQWDGRGVSPQDAWIYLATTHCPGWAEAQTPPS